MLSAAPGRQEITAHGIGASEIAAALGLSPYKSPLELWLEKTGQRESFVGNAATDWGHDVEPALREWYVRRHEVAVWVPDRSLYHPDVEWMRGTPDGIALISLAGCVSNDPTEPSVWDHGFEAKNVGWRSAHRWGEPGSDEVPVEYLLQAQQNMAVTSLERWVLVASIGGAAPAEYTVRRDEELIADLTEQGGQFWSRVVRGVPPEIDGSAAWSGYLGERYPFAREDFVPASAEDERNIIALRDVRAGIRELEQREAALENLIKASIGDRAGIESELGRLTWKPVKPRAITDWEVVAVNIADERGVSLGELEARAAANTKYAKASRAFKVPRTWSATSVGG